MANKGGKQTRRKVPEPIIPVEPEYKPIAKCIHCKRLFSPSTITGDYLARRCPLCGQPISSGDYDALAHEIAASLSKNESTLMPLKGKITLKSETLVKLRRWWQAPARWIIKRQLDGLRKVSDPLENEIKELKSRLYKTSRDRYHTSEWFLRTGIPLERTLIEPYKLKTGYNRKGEFTLSAKDSTSAGIKAEWHLFERLLEEVSEESSPLFRAQLLPNIYLPHQRRNGSFWSQIDLVLLTSKAVFVIEVKSRSCRITANAPFKTIESDGSKKWESSETLTLALTQNSKHACDFFDACDALPFERIYEQVVFYEPKSFSTDSPKFIDNVNVSCMVTNNQDDFVSAIRNELEGLDEIIDKNRLTIIGESLLDKFGDITQKRFQVHHRRLARL